MPIALLLAAVSPATAIPPGIYTNEEEVYFDGEAKRASAPWLGISIDASGKVTPVDRFGEPGKTRPVAVQPSKSPDRLIASFANRDTELRRARTATCWGAVPKDAKKPDGGTDWYGVSALRLHDQGGRVQFGGGDTGAPPVVLRMRNVIWPSGPSRPSLVLYVHKPDSPDRAEAYSWADPGAKRVGINLRWMQASCTIDGLE